MFKNNTKKEGENNQYYFIIAVLSVILLLNTSTAQITLEDETSTTITITNGIIYCDIFQEGGQGYHFIDTTIPGVITIINTTNTSSGGMPGTCNHPDGVHPDNLSNDIYYQRCCPTGYNCSIYTGQPHYQTTYEMMQCSIPTEIFEQCSDFKSIESCSQSMSAAIAKDEIDRQIAPEGLKCGATSQNYFKPICAGSTECCSNSSECKCIWNGTGCNALQNITSKCNLVTITTEYTCTWVLKNWDDQCSNPDAGYIDATWVQISDPLGEGTTCLEPERNRKIPCDAPVKLEFFGIMNIISVISILFIFYLYKVYSDKKNKNNIYRHHILPKHRVITWP